MPKPPAGTSSAPRDSDQSILRAVDVTLAEIARMPERYPVVRGSARRALLRRFPYSVFFVAGPELVSVIACLHARRDPRHWQERSEADR